MTRPLGCAINPDMIIRSLTPLRCALLVLVAIGLSACEESADDRDLLTRVLSANTQSPEEFAVVPNKPLTLPEDLASLPPPQPGITSRSELDPRADAIAALGGGQRGVRADGRLLAALGVSQADPNIRTTLAREARDFRENNPGLILDRMFGRMTDPVIFRGQLLDPAAEVERLRAAGVRVPQMAPVQ